MYVCTSWCEYLYSGEFVSVWAVGEWECCVVCIGVNQEAKKDT